MATRTVQRPVAATCDALRRIVLSVYLRIQLMLAPPRAVRERGDSPVPTSIIIAGLAALAAVVVGWAVTKANAAMSSAP